MSPRKKEEWIELTEAAAIISKNSEHPVSLDYVRLLGYKEKISRTEKNKREHLYLKSDVERIRVRQKRRETHGATSQGDQRDDVPRAA